GGSSSPEAYTLENEEYCLCTNGLMLLEISTESSCFVQAVPRQGLTSRRFQRLPKMAKLEHLSVAWALFRNSAKNPETAHSRFAARMTGNHGQMRFREEVSLRTASYSMGAGILGTLR